MTSNMVNLSALADILVGFAFKSDSFNTKRRGRSSCQRKECVKAVTPLGR